MGGKRHQTEREKMKEEREKGKENSYITGRNEAQERRRGKIKNVEESRRRKIKNAGEREERRWEKHDTEEG